VREIEKSYMKESVGDGSRTKPIYTVIRPIRSKTVSSGPDGFPS